MIKKVANFEIFLERKDLYGIVSEELKEELQDWSELNEASVFDKIKTSLSKTLFGDFSRIGIIDNIRKENLALRKQIIEKKYQMEEDLEDLLLKKSEVRKKSNQSALQSVDSQIDKKKQEFVTFKKTAEAKINKGLDLLEKTIEKNKRRKEYYETGLKEDELILAEFEYDLAKRKSSDASEISKLKTKIQKVQKEADDLIQAFTKKTSTPNKKTP
jgi:hypothetical protein